MKVKDDDKDDEVGDDDNLFQFSSLGHYNVHRRFPGMCDWNPTGSLRQSQKKAGGKKTVSV